MYVEDWETTPGSLGVGAITALDDKRPDPKKKAKRKPIGFHPWPKQEQTKT